ncbi:MAG: DNA mismatch repair protein MutS [Planctomycetes bacterium]|nr:DNA mismatch repair protein MutS [Planctomycetota bacterium]
MMQQYRETKDRYPHMLVLFRVGDFFELFGSDAEAGARILGLTLTTRDKTLPMAGFPHHALDSFVRKLVQAGQSVVVCDQVEDPAAAQGLVRREVVRVLTPGTVTEEDLLDPRRANHLASVWPEGDRVGLAWVELSTGTFQAADVAWDRLPDELGRLAPAECLHADTAPGRFTQLLQNAAPNMTLTARPDWSFDPAAGRAALFRHFQVATLAGFGFDDHQPCVASAGALLLYLQETCKAGLGHLRRLRPYRPDQFLILDEVTRRGLELTRTLREGTREGSLLSFLDRTVTPMGARLFQESVLAPLTDRRAIDARLDAVAEFMEEHGPRRQLREALEQVADLHRLSTRASTGRASPRDLAAVGRTLHLLPAVRDLLTNRRAGLLRELDRHLELCTELAATLAAALADEPPADAHAGGVIRAGFDVALDQLRAVAGSAKEWMAHFQAEEAARTGIPNLKVGYNQVFGYFLEVGHTNLKKVPTHYQRKQTLKNAERYVTPELKEYEEKALTAEEQIRQREFELFVSLRNQLAAHTSRLQRSAEVLARLDVLAALAELAESRHYCRPELCDDPVLDIREGRHPVLDQTLPPGTFVPNDILFGPEHGRLWLITGPNLSGKSTFIRQVALLTLMAQMGSFVPARQARVGIVDRIFTRVGASDDLGRGQSTFMVEMTEAANILHNATARSLVILDEIGRGTSTYDGVSLAWAITEYLHDHLGCRALFATHYHELAQLAETLPGLRNYNVLVREGEGDILFLHQIAPGSADKSYGIHVARLAGMPREVLNRAEAILGDLEARPWRAGGVNPLSRRLDSVA